MTQSTEGRSLETPNRKTFVDKDGDYSCYITVEWDEDGVMTVVDSNFVPPVIRKADRSGGGVL